MPERFPNTCTVSYDSQERLEMHAAFVASKRQNLPPTLATATLPWHARMETGEEVGSRWRRIIFCNVPSALVL